jgi:hypothetical protein
MAVAFATCCAALLGAATLVDPLGILGEPIQGFNHYKLQQRNAERIFKPYQHAAARPDVVLFGTSRVGRSMRASWPGYPDEAVYNYALSGSLIEETILTVDHVLRTHPPKVMVVGIDRTGLTAHRDPVSTARARGWDPAREWALENGLGFPFRLRDGVFSIDTLSWMRETLRASRRHDEDRFHERGYRVDWGEGGLSRQRWLVRTREYYDDRRDRRIPNYLVRAIGEAVQRWRESGVEVHVVFLPEHADIVVQAHHLPARREGLEDVKRLLASYTPFWDFFQVDGWTRDERNFSDAGHPARRFGDRMVERIHGARGGPGRRITTANVDRVLKRQRVRADAYLDENPFLHDLIERKHPRKVFERRLKRHRRFLR